jgi:hypothetical protein
MGYDGEQSKDLNGCSTGSVSVLRHYFNGCFLKIDLQES